MILICPDGRSCAEIDSFLEELFAAALSRGAEEIHLELRGGELSVRLRVGGKLYEGARFSGVNAPALLEGVERAGGLDPAQRQRPREGLLGRAGSRPALRVWACPGRGGERIVFRASPPAPATDLAGLGMHPDTRRAVEEALSGAAGLLVIAGETASGRTTTLYRLLSWLRARGLAVESIEEYIDAPLPGVTQLAIDPAAGAGHAALLRSAMRRDPDIIGVDPIRDRESAGCAIQAGLCAYRVIATMRGSSAAGPLRRLLEVGIDPVLTAMAVAGVLVQRLARRVCVGCRLPGEPTAEERERLWLAPGQLIYRARPGGCVGCRGLGYLGRVGLFSFLPFDDELRRLFLASGPAALGRAARRRGLPTLLDDGVYKLLDGVTTPGELLESLLGAPGWEGEGG